MPSLGMITMIGLTSVYIYRSIIAGSSGMQFSLVSVDKLMKSTCGLFGITFKMIILTILNFFVLVAFFNYLIKILYFFDSS